MGAGGTESVRYNKHFAKCPLNELINSRALPSFGAAPIIIIRSVSLLVGEYVSRNGYEQVLSR